VPFGRVLYIERDDFREVPPKKFFRLSPGQEVRLRYAYLIRCESLVKDAKTGEVTELHCTYDPESLHGAPDGRRVRGTLHWVSAGHALAAEVRLYDRLFLEENPDAAADLSTCLNPHSLEVRKDCLVEPGLGDAPPGGRYQFERQGYFTVDRESARGRLVFNRTVSLRDTWAKIEKALQSGPSSG
jgi:glutaminyl-tRNA synthetase